MKNLVKYLIGIFAIVFIAAIVWLGYDFYKKQTAQKGKARTVAELAEKTDIKQNREDLLIVGLDGGFPPMTFTDSKGQTIGFDVDLAKKALSDSGKELVFKSVVWEEKEADLANKKIDLIWSGLTITNERKKIFTFSEPYFDNAIIGVVAKGSSILTLDDIGGVLAGHQKGADFISELVTTYENSQGRGVSSIKSDFDDLPAALTGLLLGDADVVFGDKTAILYYTSRSANAFRVLPGSLQENTLGIAMRKGDTQMQQLVNNALNKLKSNGEYQQVYEKWFGAASN